MWTEFANFRQNIFQIGTIFSMHFFLNCYGQSEQKKSLNVNTKCVQVYVETMQLNICDQHSADSRANILIKLIHVNRNTTNNSRQYTCVNQCTETSVLLTIIAIIVNIVSVYGTRMYLYLYVQ